MQTVLIANRGEIAVRVIRACREAGLSSVAVYADQDFDAMHVSLADAAYALPGTTAEQTYMNAQALLAAAAASGADAVHPGYGFLAESAEFARAVEDAGLTWIGPTPASIEALGDKLTARAIARRAGAPLAAGSDEPLTGPDEAIAFAREHGLPVVIKAAHGGGGRGLKVVRSIAEIHDAFDSATREAQAAFGRAECFIERYLEEPRHIETQILGDGSGDIIVVGDRDCSLQRRGQKLIEEAPAPGLSDDQRSLIHEASRRICAEVRYRGAGTVEFLLARDGTISFLEVNTRLQVEHPITEAVTGVDLVREQLRIAAGEPCGVAATPEPVGHAIEFRINAEDPGRGFLPSPGEIRSLRVPGGPGIRWDAGVEAGDRVEPAFDSLAAKLIVHGPDRDAALARSRRALAELHVEGVATVADLARTVLDEPDFQTESFAVSTQWIEQHLMPRLAVQPRAQPAAGTELRRMAVEIDGRRVALGLPPELFASQAPSLRDYQPEASQDEASLAAPVPGAVVAWLIEDGVQVTAGAEVVVLSAMKMETRVAAHRTGVLRQRVAVGDTVAVDETLAVIDEP